MQSQKITQALGGVVGVILAGGLARRMGGGDKTLKSLSGIPMLGHVIRILSPQADLCIINANGDPARFSEFKCPVIADPLEEHPGPLAGVLAGMLWVQKLHPACAYIATVPGDSPFLPSDLIERLAEPILQGRAILTCAASAGRAHPVIGLWPARLAGDLKQALMVENIRKVDRWTGRYPIETVEFSSDPFDPFFNINTQEDLDQAEGFFK